MSPGTLLRFTNRREAGLALADQLTYYAGEPGALVLGLPRGGVVVAEQIAKVLRLPLDALIVRKIGYPRDSEYAIGAIAAGVAVINHDIARRLDVTENEIRAQVENERKELERREMLYREGRPLAGVSGHSVIVADDGIATGYTMLAALKALKTMSPSRLIAAAPVCSEESCRRLKGAADEVVCLMMPREFHAVGQAYEEFDPVSDEEVISILNGSRSRRGHARAA